MTKIHYIFIICLTIFIAAPSIWLYRNVTTSNRNLKLSSPIPSPSVQNTHFATDSPTPKPTLLLSPKPTNPSPTATTTHQDENLNSWRYPGSSLTGSSAHSLSLKSIDNPTTITNWYKDQIRNLGMNTKTFVSTNSNGNILNKLAGANQTLNITIEITKQSNQSATTMTLTQAKHEL